MLELQYPNSENLVKTINGLKEIKRNPNPYDIRQCELLIQYMEKNFEGLLDFLKERASEKQPEGWVPDTTLLLFDGDKFIGVFNIRHKLNDFLMKRGGNIAYEIIPSERGKGYCKAGLKLSLEWAKKNLHLDKVLVTCNALNVASHKAMLSVMKDIGGIEKEDLQLADSIENGVWIDIKTNV